MSHQYLARCQSPVWKWNQQSRQRFNDSCCFGGKKWTGCTGPLKTDNSQTKRGKAGDTRSHARAHTHTRAHTLTHTHSHSLTLTHTHSYTISNKLMSTNSRSFLSRQTGRGVDLHCASTCERKQANKLSLIQPREHGALTPQTKTQQPPHNTQHHVVAPVGPVGVAGRVLHKPPLPVTRRVAHAEGAHGPRVLENRRR